MGAPEEIAQWPVCRAVQLARCVDGQINGGARQEFLDATSKTQASGADLNEGNAYLDDAPVLFTARSIACGLCQDEVRLLSDGSIQSGNCKVSGSCELEWAKRYPDRYRDENGDFVTDRLVCGAEVGCSALIRLVSIDGKSTASLINGVCEVARRGGNWRKRCEEEFKRAACTDPESGIEEFDGQGSDRENPSSA